MMTLFRASIFPSRCMGGLCLLVCLTCLSCARGDNVASIRDLIRLKLELKNADDWVVSRAIFERFTGLGFEG